MGQELTTSYPEGTIGSDVARAALDRSRDMVASTQLAHEIVEAQAVAALTRQGLTVRQIAQHLDLSKSKVGRLAASLTSAPTGWAVRSHHREALQQLIRELWAVRG